MQFKNLLVYRLANGTISPDFTIDQDLELRAADASKATVRYVRHDLAGKDIRAHIASGKTVTRLGMTWKDKISFGYCICRHVILQNVGCVIYLTAAPAKRKLLRRPADAGPATAAVHITGMHLAR